jgi:hypothetical protein
VSFVLGSEAIIIIHAEALPLGKMIVFITIRVISAICPGVGLSQPQSGTNRNPALASCAWST